MENKGHAGIYAIVAAVITAIAGIITTILTITGPIVDKRMAIQATQTREAILAASGKVGGVTLQLTATPVPALPTATVAAALAEAAQAEAAKAEPTQAAQPTRPALPTVTLPQPSADANPQPQATATPSETYLKVGEGVTSNGITVKLTKVEFPAGNEVHLHFTFTNATNKVVNISLDHNRDVTLTDDKGNVYQWATAFSWDVSIYPGTTRNDEVKRRGDVSKAAYFIIKLEVPGLLSATWKN